MLHTVLGVQKFIGYTPAMPDSAHSNKQVLTLGEVLEDCHEALEDSGVFFGHGTDNAWDEAVQLVLSVAGLPLDADAAALSNPVDEAVLARVRELLNRRIVDREPLPYLLGRAWFAGLEFHCDPRAIVPRSPLAEMILNEFQPWYAGPEPTRILDLCCGGGCIGLATAHYFPRVSVDLVDVDSRALDLCRENRALLGLEDRVSVIQSDLFAALAGASYDLILCNPPYVNAEDLAAMPAEYHREPERALGSGPDGLALTRRILSGAGDFLREQGLLVVEVGNSWPQLEALYPRVPFTWVEFEHGGDGVFALTAQEWQKYGSSWRQ